MSNSANPHDEQIADLLEQYLNDLESNPQAQPPRGLDPQLIEAVQKMNAHVQAPEPRPEFVASLRKQLDREAAQLAHAKSSPTRGFFSLPRWSLVGISAALIIAFGAIVFYGTRPAPVDAAQVLGRASTVANNLAATGVKSFELESQSEQIIVGDAQQPIAGTSNTITNMAYAGPTLWRVQGTTTTTLGDTIKTLNISDGATLWTYDAYNNVALADVATGDQIPLPNVGSLDLLRQDWSNCYTPQVIGEETIANRHAYKIDLGANKCRSAALFMFEGTRTLWVDKETFFVLRDEFVGSDGKQNLGSYNVTKVQYNIDLPPGLFEYAPPPGAAVTDNRPKPAPSADAYQSQLGELARNAAYPLFVPSSLPAGLIPRVPQVDTLENSIKLEYVPADEASTNTMADSNGVIIRQQLADYNTIRNWTDGSEIIDLSGIQGWIRRGDFQSGQNVGSNSAIMLVRDGTLISISSFAISPEQLIEIANALEPVPGGHAPLPNPTAPTLDELRAQSGLPFFVPTYVPEGLTAEPPTSNQVQYHRADGSIGLIVQNAKQGEGGMEADPRFNGKVLSLANGIEAHQLGFEPAIIILWWHQGGGYISLEGHGIPEQDMLQIANSMSSTAELGPTEPPPARPTPTSVPAPSFTVLRPSFLPEEMTVTETNVPAPDGQVSGIEIRFDPHPGGTPHDMLTVTEYPQETAETTIVDDQAITQEIGGRYVTIVKRGEGCVTYHWVQDGLALTLTNPYDPPGAPGQVRYPCDQMERIVASFQ